MNSHACHLLWLTWSGRFVYLYDGSRSCHLLSSEFLWYGGCIKFTSHCIPGFCSKGIPWRIGSFWTWQPDKCIILHHHLYILLNNRERTLNFTFRSGLRRLCRLLDNGNFDVIFDARFSARCWITPLWVRPEPRACLEVSFIVKNSVMYTYLLVLLWGSWRV